MNPSPAKFFLAFLALIFPPLIGWISIYISYTSHPASLIDPFGVTGISILAGSLLVEFSGIALYLKKYPLRSTRHSSVILTLLIMSGCFYYLVCSRTYDGFYTDANPTLIIDNGDFEPIDVTVDGLPFHVGADDHLSLRVITGKLTIVFRDSTKAYRISRGTWIYNPGRKNNYRIETDAYSTGGGWSIDEGIPDRDFGNAEYFQVTTDFIFEEPKTISSQSMETTRTVLKH